MRFIALLLLIFGFQLAHAQDEPPLDELEVEGELIEEEFEDEEMEEPRQPPPPPMRPNRFRNSGNRFGGNKRSFKRGGRSGGGQDRLGKTEGKIQFELVDPPKYYKRKNRPYIMPPSN